MALAYDWTGAPDPTFGAGGVVVHHGAAGGNDDDSGKDLVIDGSGRVVVTGYSRNGSDPDMVIWRYR